MKAYWMVAIAFLIVGCTARVSTKEDLIGAGALSETRECYTYASYGGVGNAGTTMDAAANAALLSVFLGPAAAPVLLGASAMAERPSKCGLRVEDAINEAWAISYYEKSTSKWSKKDGTLDITVSPTFILDERCSIHSIKLISKQREYSENIEVCRDGDGVPQLVKQNIPNEYIAQKKQERMRRAYQGGYQ